MNNEFCITRDEMQTFADMKGKRFDFYKADPFVYSPMVFGIVGISVSGETYKVSAKLKETQRFNTIEEVVCLNIEKAPADEIKSLMDGGEMITTPVMNTIESIVVVTDYQTLIKDSERKSFAQTIGYIFKMTDGLEISFEIGSWFSEMIIIRKGYDLIKEFTSADDFYEEWEDTGYIAESNREIKNI